MEKMSLIFTNGIYASVVVVFEKEEEFFETYLERALSEIILPNEYFNLVFTGEEINEENEEYFIHVNDDYYFYDENLIVKMLSDKEIENYENYYVSVYSI